MLYEEKSGNPVEHARSYGSSIISYFFAAFIFPQCYLSKEQIPLKVYF
jgi:hypothetical protein